MAQRRKGPRRGQFSQQPLTPVDYRGFGPFGTHLQERHETIWRIIEENWEALPPQIEQNGLRVSKPPIDQLLTEQFDRIGWLYERVMVQLTERMGALDASGALELWEALRSSFSPALPAASELAANSRAVLLRRYFVEQLWHPIYANAETRKVISQYNAISYAPFTQGEMSYLRRRHPRIVEVGAGSGYFAWLFLQQGGDIIAHDNDHLGISKKGLFRWTNELIEGNNLIVTDEFQSLIQQNADRSLLIACPEGGSSFPTRAIKIYAAAGGRFLILKLGGSIGYGTQQEESLQKQGENVVRFLELLSHDWKEVHDQDRPFWNPLAWGDNLLVFGRKS